MAAPVDLNILYESSALATERKVLTAFKLGYSAVAVNYVTSSLHKQSYGLPASQGGVPRAKSILVPEAKIKALGIRRELKQYTRITIEMRADLQMKRLEAPDIMAYDIIALQPTSERLAQVACQSVDVDIISFKFTENLGYYIQRKAIKKTRTRNTFIEVTYSPAIRDRTLRKNLIANTSDLMSLLCGARNTLLTSGCENPMELRCPKDVVNLGQLFGLKETESKDALTTNARAVLVRAASRKAMKRAVKVEMIHDSRKTSRTPMISMVTKEEEEQEDDESDDEDEEFGMEPDDAKRPLDNEENGVEEGDKKRIKLVGDLVT